MSTEPEERPTNVQTVVVTYQYAYIRGTIALCARHREHTPDWVPALGPVSHGEHVGVCQACWYEDIL